MNANEIENAVDAYLGEMGVTYAVTLSDKGHDKGGWECDAWRVTFSRGKSAFSCPYYTGIGHRAIPEHARAIYNTSSRQLYDRRVMEQAAKPVLPRAASVLYALLRDAEAADMSFPDFCGELGYDEDSRKAFATYMQCCDTARELRAVFTRTERERLAELLREY